MRQDRERERTRQEVVDRGNAQRRKAGVGPLTPHPALQRAAQEYAELMAQRGHFSHTGPDGSTPAERARRAGYDSGFSGENIAMGQRNAAEVVEGWMRSDGHRENLLRREFKDIGVGVAWSRRGRYWVQLFGSPR